MLRPHLILCLSCARLYEATGPQQPCPECGSSHDPGRYKRILRISEEAARYGYQYRTAYEDELGEDEEYNGASCLAPLEELLLWLAAAAISGALGNATYDLIKLVMAKITKQARNSMPSYLLDVIQDMNELDLFIRYIQEYPRGMPSAHPTVLKSVAEEIAVEQRIKERYQGLSNPAELPKGDEPSEIDFEGMWAYLDKSG